MCGRMNMEEYPTWRQLYEYYSIIPSKRDKDDDEWRMGDMKPTDPVPIVAHRKGQRRMTMARWWFVPRYVKELSTDYHMFNARSDRLREKFDHWKSMPVDLQACASAPYLRSFLDGRKCLIPMNGYYEFKNGQPYLFTIEGAEVFSVAGLWEWNSHIKTPEWPNGILSCTMITTEPNEVAEPIHDRMPVILRPHQYERWLSVETSYDHAMGMLHPYHGKDLRVSWAHVDSLDQLTLM